MRRIVMAVVVGLIVSLAGLTAATSPASANPINPGASDCGASYSKSRSGSYVTLSLRYTCSYTVFQINHGLTLQRGSNAFIASTKYCAATAGIKTCTRKWTFKDPAGSQHYYFYDELRVRYNPWDGEGFSLLYQGSFWA